MKVMIYGLALVTVLAGVGAVGLMMSTTARYATAGTALCPVAIVTGLLFLYLAARQSRLDRQ